MNESDIVYSSVISEILPSNPVKDHITLDCIILYLYIE